MDKYRSHYLQHTKYRQQNLSNKKVTTPNTTTTTTTTTTTSPKASKSNPKKYPTQSSRRTSSNDGSTCSNSETKTAASSAATFSTATTTTSASTSSLDCTTDSPSSGKCEVAIHSSRPSSTTNTATNSSMYHPLKEKDSGGGDGNNNNNSSTSSRLHRIIGNSSSSSPSMKNRQSPTNVNVNQNNREFICYKPLQEEDNGPINHHHGNVLHVHRSSPILNKAFNHTSPKPIVNQDGGNPSFKPTSSKPTYNEDTITTTTITTSSGSSSQGQSNHRKSISERLSPLHYENVHRSSPIQTTKPYKINKRASPTYEENVSSSPRQTYSSAGDVNTNTTTEPTTDPTTLFSHSDRHKDEISEPSTTTTNCTNHSNPNMASSNNSNNIHQNNKHNNNHNNKNNTSTSQTTQNHAILHMVPTEAQLRWAQFHQKKRAAVIQERIRMLMLYPSNVDEVDGALSDDGDSSSSGSDSDNGNGNRNDGGNNVPKMKISRGRRALLKVSARAVKERQIFIKNNGYTMDPEEDDMLDTVAMDNDTVGITTTDRSFVSYDVTEALDIESRKDSSSHPIGGDSGSGGKKELNMIGTTIYGRRSRIKKSKSIKKKGGNRSKRLKGRRSMVNTADEDEERMKRFEEAYEAMCSVTTTTTTTTPSSSSSTMMDAAESDPMKSGKRWTRASNIQAAISIDGREYEDLQRMPAFNKHSSSSKRGGAETIGALVNGDQLVDRTASWMVHLPKYERCENNMANSYTSPKKQKMMELVNRLQNLPMEEEKISINVRSLSRSLFPNTSYTEKNTTEYEPMKQIVEENSETGDSIYYDEVIDHTNTSMEDINDIYGGNPMIEGHIEREVVHEDVDAISQTLKVDNQEHKGSRIMKFRGKLNPLILKKLDRQKEKIKAAFLSMPSPQLVTDKNSDVHGVIDQVGKKSSTIQNLTLSPTVLSKRLQQAVHAVQSHDWVKVGHLLNANPWLAEMTDVTNQYLLHKVAYHGAGDESDIIAESAPSTLNEDLINAFPTSIYKFDEDGNLALHKAAETGNVDMLERLIQRFPGGTSVRNEKGFLPLHLIIKACTKPAIVRREKSPILIVKTVLESFPAALAVSDNEGNFPIHLAAQNLKGDIGVEIIYFLVDEAERQGQSLRFSPKIRGFKRLDKKDDIMLSDSATEICSTVVESKESSIANLKNSLEYTPLMCAIKYHAGWQVIEALLTCEGVEDSILEKDESNQNILQLTMQGDHYDPSAVLSILKTFPKLATIPFYDDDDNALMPIEVACMQGLQVEVIIAIALVDLPLDLDAKEDLTIRKGYGKTWWYLTCECDDANVDVVKEILALCTYSQTRELCSVKNKNGRSIISRATPKCKLEMRKALRFGGRYEFTSTKAIKSRYVQGLEVFKALDFGDDDNGREVFLKYYGEKESFYRDTFVLHKIDIVPDMFVPMNFFTVDDLQTNSDSNPSSKHCITIDIPSLTLSTILKSEDNVRCRSDPKRFKRFLHKTRQVLLVVGNCINYLHKQDVIHGNLNTETCGKFHDGWKVMDLIGLQFVNAPMHRSRFGLSLPPETVEVHGRSASIRETIPASTSLDVWSFGRLLYEVLVGKPLFSFDLSRKIPYDEKTLLEISCWGQHNIREVIDDISAEIGNDGGDLISRCLSPNPSDRPEMKEILWHPFWGDRRRAEI